MAEPLEVNHLATSHADLEARVLAALEAAGLRPAAESRAGTRTSCPAASGSGSSSPVRWRWDPELVVADEPVSMLDVSIRTELLRLMLDLRKERGLTYLFITHDLSLAWVIADRIAVMYLGRIMEIGPAEEVIKHSHHPYTRALVGGDRRHPTRSTMPPARPRVILKGETPNAAAHPVRLPVPPALPAGIRPVPRRGAAVVRRGGGPAGRLLAG